ncbi:RluA family pseudouridine synthase [Govanella unica]|uniref:Pseudouridine synthase n=1 Tax=Govanella unica TaxID=2975056 RepID=A0A9X3TW57_9PROT|nr:RluA family pseudouridine synthase [Govania unica]MDA5193085.1 RluA family pseudouridine synthase [Govania unica]
MSGVIQKTVSKDEDGIRLDRWFKKHFPGLPFARLSKILRNGNVRVDGKRAKTADRLPEGAVVRVPPLGEQPEAPAPAPVVVRPEDVALLKSMILYEDNDVIVLNKVPGLAVQGGSGTTRHIDGMLDGLAVDGVRPRLVHRLDRDTSGVLILARTGQAAAALGKAFHSRAAQKLYWALVIGRPGIGDGLIKAPLAKEPGPRGERMEVNEDEGKAAITKFHVMDTAGTKTAWLALMPLTGRTHQLRAHCAHMGTPIVGDGKYAASDAYLTGTISRKLHLHARRLIVPHPKRAGVMIDVTAPLPDHMRETWKTFGFDPDDRSMPFSEK